MLGFYISENKAILTSKLCELILILIDEFIESDFTFWEYSHFFDNTT